MDDDDAKLIAAVVRGDHESFEPLVRKHQSRVFGVVRRYARRQSEVEDIVQDVFIKAYQKAGSFRGEAPFEHWLMRLTIRTCYDYLRAHQRNRELTMTDLSESEVDWLERFHAEPDGAAETAAAARELVRRVLDRLSPAARLVITLLAIEERSVKEIARLTGWSVPLVKVRAFRARKEMRRILEKMMRHGTV